MPRVRRVELETVDFADLRRRSLSQIHQLDEAVDSLQRHSKSKDRRLLSNVDQLLLWHSQHQPVVRMSRASSLPPPSARQFRHASPSPYDPNTANFYFLPTSHLRASSVAPSSVHDTNEALDDCRKVLRRSGVRSQSYQDLYGDSDLSPAANRAIRHAYAGPRVIVMPSQQPATRIRNIPLPRKPPSAAQPSQERRRIERHLESLVSYEMPSPENFTNMRSRLNSINDKQAPAQAPALL